MFVFYCKINVCSIGCRAINQKAYFYKMKVSKAIFIFLLCLQFDWIYGQNLVKNYSFEERRKPDLFNIYSSLVTAKYWKNPNKASPDFHENNRLDKFLQLGESHADSGRYFVGITFETESTYEYYEYIETKLADKLNSGKLYCFEISVLFSSTAPYCVDNLQFALSNKFLKGNKHKPLIAENIVTLSNGLLLNNPIKYIKLSSVYLAKGGEQFLTIGQFNRNAKYYPIEYIKNRNAFANKSPYYFFDNVVLRLIKDSAECPCYEEMIKQKIKHDTIKLSEISTNRSYQNAICNLTQVNFKTNIYVLQSPSYPELDTVVSILKKDNLLKITVSGHTDITGVFLKNFELSEKRAKSIPYSKTLHLLRMRGFYLSGRFKSIQVLLYFTSPFVSPFRQFH